MPLPFFGSGGHVSVTEKISKPPQAVITSPQQFLDFSNADNSALLVIFTNF